MDVLIVLPQADTLMHKYQSSYDLYYHGSMIGPSLKFCLRGSKKQTDGDLFQAMLYKYNCSHKKPKDDAEDIIASNN